MTMLVPGYGGSGLYCGHAPSYNRYVGTVLVGVILAGFPGAGFLRGRLLGVGPLGAGFLESAIL